MSADSDYEANYRAWVESLPPEERVKLRDQGLEVPLNDHGRVSGHLGEEEDPGGLAVGTLEAPEDLGVWLTDTEIPEDRACELVEHVRNHLERQQILGYSQALNRVIGELLASPNVRLSCVGLCFALGLDAVNGLGTMAQCAKGLCVTRASISKAAQEWRKLLGEHHISPHLKSKEAREAYSQAQLQKHWRRQTWKKSL